MRFNFWDFHKPAKKAPELAKKPAVRLDADSAVQTTHMARNASLVAETEKRLEDAYVKIYENATQGYYCASIWAQETKVNVLEAVGEKLKAKGYDVDIAWYDCMNTNTIAIGYTVNSGKYLNIRWGKEAEEFRAKQKEEVAKKKLQKGADRAKVKESKPRKRVRRKK